MPLIGFAVVSLVNDVETAALLSVENTLKLPLENQPDSFVNVLPITFWYQILIDRRITDHCRILLTELVFRIFAKWYVGTPPRPFKSPEPDVMQLVSEGDPQSNMTADRHGRVKEDLMRYLNSLPFTDIRF
jgi:hypothetical protein